MLHRMLRASTPTVTAAVFTVIAVAGWCASASEPPAANGELATRRETARVLIVTGEDCHEWRQTTPALKQLLEKDPRLTVDVLEDLAGLATRDLTPYAAVVLHFKNYKPETPGRAGFDNLAKFAQQGGGLVFVHFACGAFEEFQAEFGRLAGRVWFGEPAPPGRHQHDPYGTFVVRVTDTTHPITANLGDFEATDELYTCLVGEAPIRTLASATSQVDGKPYPMVFVLEPGSARVFHCALGHNVQSLSVPQVGELYRRGTAWACRLEPVARP